MNREEAKKALSRFITPGYEWDDDLIDRLIVIHAELEKKHGHPVDFAKVARTAYERGKALLRAQAALGTAKEDGIPITVDDCDRAFAKKERKR